MWKQRVCKPEEDLNLRKSQNLRTIPNEITANVTSMSANSAQFCINTKAPNFASQIDAVMEEQCYPHNLLP